VACLRFLRKWRSRCRRVAEGGGQTGRPYALAAPRRPPLLPHFLSSTLALSPQEAMKNPEVRAKVEELMRNPEAMKAMQAQVAAQQVRGTDEGRRRRRGRWAFQTSAHPSRERLTC